MEEIELEVLEIGGKEYAVIYENDEFLYTGDINNIDDLRIFAKYLDESNEECIRDAYEEEYSKAMAQFSEQYEKENKEA